jgi:cytochrome c oxidase assembly factor 6
MWNIWPFGGSGGKKPEIPKQTPSREDRTKCWESRDSFFACLDKSSIVSPADRGTSCQAEAQLYEQDCAKSWVCVEVQSICS